MILVDRRAKILNAAVESFIEKGEPVSSQWLYEHYDFGIKPAMIRHELEALSGEGFLEQPHHSAGRIPGDKGFEFFARAMLEIVEDGVEKKDKELRNMFERHAWGSLLGELAGELGVLGVLGNEEGEVEKKGLECLMENLSWETPEEIQRVIRDFVELDVRMESMLEDWKGDALQVFVGKRSPVTKSEELAVVMGKYELPHMDVIVCTIGPKRMNYRRVIQIMRNIEPISNE